MTITASVIIPTYNDDVRLQKCLDALARQSLGTSAFEVIVVNNSRDRRPGVTADALDLILIDEPEPGSYAARNTGIRACSGSIVAFTDSDCIPDEKWLEAGIRAMRAAKVPRVAGRVQIFARGDCPTATECYEMVFAFDQKENVRKGVSVTANLFVDRGLFDRIGYFDASSFSGGDVEWNSRATRSGAGIAYSPDAFVRHPARRGWGELAAKLRRVTGGKFKLDSRYRLSLIRSLLPPFEAIGMAAPRRDLSVRTRVLACVVAYRIKLYRYYYWRCLRGGLAPLER